MAGFLGFITQNPLRLFIYTLLILPFGLFAKGKPDSTGYSEILACEKAVKDIAPRVVSGETDSIRFESAWILYRSLDTMLHMPAARYYPFDSLRLRTVSVLTAPDEKFRIFTFNLITKAGDFKQFGYLEVRNGKEVEIFNLLDTAKKPQKDYLESELETEHWLGALYYKIVPAKVGKKKHYILMGFDGATANSNKKILDVLWFDNETPVFGKPIFLDGSHDMKPAYRVVFEYHNESSMVLSYDEDRKVIVLDKLVPSFPEAVNDFPYYIPSGDYDCFAKNKKGYWVREALKDFDFGQGTKPRVPTERPHPSDPYREP